MANLKVENCLKKKNPPERKYSVTFRLKCELGSEVDKLN